MSCADEGDANPNAAAAYRSALFHIWITRASELRFGPSIFVNHQAASSKLHQTGIVTEYQQQFETLSNRVNGMSPESN